jgi:MFS family permease
LLGLAAAWSAVLLLRFLDRVGKGLRTAPRDALIAGAVPAAQRGRAFGFHRSMDHAGAVIGPLIAFALLAAHVPLEHVFLASVVPGTLVLLLLAFGLPRGQPFVAPPPAALPALPVRVEFAVGDIAATPTGAIVLGLFENVEPAGAALAVDARLGGAIRALARRRALGAGLRARRYRTDPRSRSRHRTRARSTSDHHGSAHASTWRRLRR